MKTRAITVDEFKLIIKTITEGFSYTDVETGKVKKFRANSRLAFTLQLQANLGIRIGDVLQLKPSSFVPNGRGGYMINIIEEKTGKPRNFDVNTAIIDAIDNYRINNNLRSDDLLFNIQERGVQKNLKIVTEYLELISVSTHSFRKFYAMRIFENNNYNFEIVRELLQHSNVGVTQKYLGVSTKEVQDALDGHVYLV